MELTFLAISRRTVYTLLLLFIVLTCTGEFQSDAQVIPTDELETLRRISTKLGISQWDNVNSNSCVTGQGLNIIKSIPGPDDAVSGVICDCSFNASTICHVTYIRLISFSLVGELPDDFANITFLREIDLTRNSLNGSIPRSWASLHLVRLSLLGNRIGGTIPMEIGSISTLEELNIQDNNIGGPLPRELGNLLGLKRALLSGNNFTGVLPEIFGNLTNLTEFRIDGSGITGRIPDFIGNWTKLERIDMQGTNMEGPIPPTFSLLTNIKQLRISDLNVSSMMFPDLRELTKLEQLVLRRCSITGSIPKYIGERMQNIKILDLSFNSLTGVIPETLDQLTKLQFLYLTNNTLSGEISPWLSMTKFYFDISYNNFNGTSQSNCRENNLNKISSFPAQPANSVAWCLKKDLPCPRKSNYYNLFVNCGGSRLFIDEEQYEQDLDGMGPSSFFSTDKWACSTTGDYVDNSPADLIVRTSTNNSTENLYSTARIAPFSLKYYGRCLRQGSYNVKLHFAEIVFTLDQRNNTLGRRIFDIYIQGERIWKDFNIAEEAGGVGKSIVKEYNANVTGSTLEIHLYWAGKGTIAVPQRSTYGPLISAISVTPNFDPSTGLSAWAIAGIVVGSFVAVLLVLAVLWKLGYLGRKDLEDKVEEHATINVAVDDAVIEAMATEAHRSGSLGYIETAIANKESLSPVWALNANLVVENLTSPTMGNTPKYIAPNFRSPTEEAMGVETMNSRALDAISSSTTKMAEFTSSSTGNGNRVLNETNSLLRMVNWADLADEDEFDEDDEEGEEPTHSPTRNLASIESERLLSSVNWANYTKEVDWQVQKKRGSKSKAKDVDPSPLPPRARNIPTRYK